MVVVVVSVFVVWLMTGVCVGECCNEQRRASLRLSFGVLFLVVVVFGCVWMVLDCVTSHLAARASPVHRPLAHTARTYAAISLPARRE